MLSSEDVQRIIAEVALGSEPTIKGPEADKLRAEIEKEMKDNPGMSVEIPREWLT